MSRKAYLFTITVVLFLSVWFFIESRFGFAEEVRPSESGIILAQNSSEEPGFFTKIKRSITNWAKDDGDDEEIPDYSAMMVPVEEEVPQVQPVRAVPMAPPKPLTAEEIRRASAEEAPPKVASAAKRPSATPAPSAAISKPVPKTAHRSVASDTDTQDATEQDESIYERYDRYKRLQSIRSQVIDETAADEDSEEIEDRPRQKTNAAPVPSRRSSPPRRSVTESRSRAATQIETDEFENYRSRVVTTDDSYRAPREPAYQEAPRNNQAVNRNDHWSDEEPEQYRRNTNNRTQSTSPEYRSRSNQATQRPAPRTDHPVRQRELPQLSGIAIETDSPWNRSDPAAAPLTAQGGRRHAVSNRTEVYEPNRAGAPAQAEGTQQQAAVKTDNTALAQNPAQEKKEKSFLVSPRIEVETEGDSRVIVGRESVYRVRVRNQGGVAADQVVLTIEVPHWIEILPPDVSTGTTAIVPRKDHQESRNFVWKISRIEAAAEEQLVMHLVPQQRKPVDLRITYDFHKPSAIAKIFVQEPVVEMELQGPDEVLWGTKVSYKLLVRNTGNGDAERVKLELLQTGSDMKSCDLPVLRSGEEQVIDVDVWTGKQESIDINIQATGAYDLSAKAFKRVTVLRPEVSVQVEAAETQFVDNPAEFVISVSNDGTAPATDIELVATIPLGARYLSNTGGGRASPQNQVLWTIPNIAVGEQFIATVICEPKREGLCKLEATINDTSGMIASCNGSFHAEAIADLRMQVENPQGPIEVGQEAVFTINVINRGTKVAEDVEVIAAFVRGLEPFAIEGANGIMNDGQVIFDKIPAISAGQTVTLKIRGKADRPGNHRMRTEVLCNAVNTHLVFEQATYFYQKHKSKRTVQTNTQMQAETEPTSPLNTTRVETTDAQPLRAAPTTAHSDDPFLR